MIEDSENTPMWHKLGVKVGFHEREAPPQVRLRTIDKPLSFPRGCPFYVSLNKKASQM
jgi:hypothetical protein